MYLVRNVLTFLCSGMTPCRLIDRNLQKFRKKCLPPYSNTLKLEVSVFWKTLVYFYPISHSFHWLHFSLKLIAEISHIFDRWMCIYCIFKRYLTEHPEAQLTDRRIIRQEQAKTDTSVHSVSNFTHCQGVIIETNTHQNLPDLTLHYISRFVTFIIIFITFIYL